MKDASAAITLLDKWPEKLSFFSGHFSSSVIAAFTSATVGHYCTIKWFCTLHTTIILAPCQKNTKPHPLSIIPCEQINGDSACRVSLSQRSCHLLIEICGTWWLVTRTTVKPCYFKPAFPILSTFWFCFKKSKCGYIIFSMLKNPLGCQSSANCQVLTINGKIQLNHSGSLHFG